MHLLTTTQTVLNGLINCVALIFLAFYIVTNVTEGSILSIVIAAGVMVLYGHSWRIYIKAFKTRAYDRNYNKVKIELRRALELVLPQAGAVEIDCGDDVEMLVCRNKNKLLGDWFSVSVMDGSDVEYNEDTMTHRVVLPARVYSLFKSQLYVNKKYEASVANAVKDDESGELVVSVDHGERVSARKYSKSRNKIPADLLHASIDDMLELNFMVASGEKGIVSE